MAVGCSVIPVPEMVMVCPLSCREMTEKISSPDAEGVMLPALTAGVPLEVAVLVVLVSSGEDRQPVVEEYS